MRLVIIECGKSKIWDKHPDAGPQKASVAYTGLYFKTNRRFAESRGCDWMILSAKYGFMMPDFVIPESYNVTFTKPFPRPISVQELRQQVKELGLERYDKVTVLGARAYVEKVEESFVGTYATIEAPFAGSRMGEQMHMINEILGGDDVNQTSNPVTEPSRRRVRIRSIGLEPHSPNIPNADVFRHALSQLLSSSLGKYVDVNAGELHDLVGTRSGKDSRMPTCCNVMLAAMQNGDTVLAAPPKGRGSTLIIRYVLPR